MSSIYERALNRHQEWKGKLKVETKAPLETADDLAIAYSPGVAEPCRIIAEDPNRAYDLTWKSHLVAIVSNGTAVLGLGNIGAQAALPVMEGKAALFKRFAGLDALPLVIDGHTVEDVISFCEMLAPSVGGINLEDIAAPACIKIERELKKRLDIPVFHDDQHGTAIVVLAGLINALKLVNKKTEDITVVVNGAGAAGSSIVNLLLLSGVKDMYVFDSKGVINQNKSQNYNFLKKELAEVTNLDKEDLSLSEAVAKSDVFIGVSVKDVLTPEMVSSMKKDPIVFALANPDPEITVENAKAAGVRVIATGRSDYPNQINNVLAFPGIFKGAFDSKATQITEKMKVAAAKGLASLISDEELHEDYIIVNPFDDRVVETVALAVVKCAIEENVVRESVQR